MDLHQHRHSAPQPFQAQSGASQCIAACVNQKLSQEFLRVPKKSYRQQLDTCQETQLNNLRVRCNLSHPGTYQHHLSGQAGGHADTDLGTHLPAQSVGLPKPTETRSMSQSEMEPSRDWL